MLVVSGCTTTTALEREYDSTGIVVGSGTTTADRIVAEIYALALRGTGVEVSTDLGVGDRFDYVRALEQGRVSVVPDDTASLLAFFRRSAQDQLATAHGSPPAEPAGTFAAAGDPRGERDVEDGDVRLAELSGVLPTYLRIADPGLAQRKQMIVTGGGGWTMRTISDLAPHCAAMRASMVAGQVSGTATIAALGDSYGCVFQDVQLADTGPAAVASVTSGDSAVAGTSNLTSVDLDPDVRVLDDDRDALPSGRLVPLFRAGTLSGAQTAALDDVAGQLTTTDLIDLVRSVDVGGDDAPHAAALWARDHGI